MKIFLALIILSFALCHSLTPLPPPKLIVTIQYSTRPLSRLDHQSIQDRIHSVFRDSTKKDLYHNIEKSGCHSMVLRLEMDSTGNVSNSRVLRSTKDSMAESILLNQIRKLAFPEGKSSLRKSLLDMEIQMDNYSVTKCKTSAEMRDLSSYIQLFGMENSLNDDLVADLDLIFRENVNPYHFERAGSNEFRKNVELFLETNHKGQWKVIKTVKSQLMKVEVDELIQMIQNIDISKISAKYTRKGDLKFRYSLTLFYGK